MAKLEVGQDGPDPVDVHVGKAIRARRKLIGCSQMALADAAAVSFQQVQKYEKASNRVSASMLVKLSERLGCAPADLLPPSCASSDITLATDFLAADGGAELARIFAQLPGAHRRAVLQIARALSGEMKSIR